MLLSDKKFTVIRHPDFTCFLSCRDQIISLIIQFTVSSLEVVDEVRAADLLGCIILISVCI